MTASTRTQANCLASIEAERRATARATVTAKHGPRPAAVPTYVSGGIGRSCNSDAKNKATFDAVFAAADAQRAWDRAVAEIVRETPAQRWLRLVGPAADRAHTEMLADRIRWDAEDEQAEVDAAERSAA